MSQFLDRAGTWPPAGTPAWNQLDDRDPRKLAAVLDGGRHWALRVDTHQEALADASKAIAATADWGEVARRMVNGRGGAYIKRSAS